MSLVSPAKTSVQRRKNVRKKHIQVASVLRQVQILFRKTVSVFISPQRLRGRFTQALSSEKNRFSSDSTPSLSPLLFHSPYIPHMLWNYRFPRGITVSRVHVKYSCTQLRPTPLNPRPVVVALFPWILPPFLALFFLRGRLAASIGRYICGREHKLLLNSATRGFPPSPWPPTEARHASCGFRLVSGRRSVEQGQVKGSSPRYLSIETNRVARRRAASFAAKLQKVVDDSREILAWKFFEMNFYFYWKWFHVFYLMNNWAM